MKREDLVDLNVFLTVAEQRSFTRAAKKLNTSQSAVSTTVRRMEEKLGLRLLTRTTRRVALTEAGERLLDAAGPAFSLLDEKLEALAELRDKPAGSVRITAPEHAARTILWPAARKLMATHPDVRIEISVNAMFTDIVAERFDAGVRLGEHIAKDMIAMRIGPEVSMTAIAAPGYLAERGVPEMPHDLADHVCISYRTPTDADFYIWEFERDGREVKVRVEGQFTCNNAPLAVEAAKAGFGIAFVPKFHSETALTEGTVERVLEDWCPDFAGYHLYYPSRRQNFPAFTLLLEELRRRREP